VFDAYGGRLKLAVPASWECKVLPFNQAKNLVDPLGALQIRRPDDDTGLTQSGPPTVLSFEREGKVVQLVAANPCRDAVGRRFCQTPETFPAEVITLNGAEVLLLRPDRL
jgi:hypothetical protein